MTQQASVTGSTPAALPPEVSGDGKRNAFHHQCSVIGNQQAYASCVDKLARRKHGALPPIFSLCSAAIGKKECQAIAMRKEELAKGQAIYFIERQRFAGLAALVDKAKEFFTTTVTKPKGPPLKALPSTTDGIHPAIGAGDYMAQALTKAVERHKANAETPEPKTPAQNLSVTVTGRPLSEFPHPVPKGTTGIVVLPGETLLQAARRINGITHN